MDFSQTQLKARSKTRIIYPFNASYDFEIPNQKGELYFYKGIIFCDENDKDICFKTFCKLNGYNPSHVCMVDDKRKHVDRMYKGISSNHCRVVGWHYTRVEYTRKPFDIQKALLKLDEMAPKLPAESLEVLETLKLR